MVTDVSNISDVTDVSNVIMSRILLNIKGLLYIFDGIN